MLRFCIVLFAIVWWSNVSWANTDTDCRRSPDLDVRLDACSKFIEDPNSTSAQKAVAYYNRGRIRADAGANKQAMQDLSAALKLNPDNAYAYAKRAHVHLATGQHQNAVADLTNALALKPRSQDFIVARGYARIIGNDLDAAVADFNTALFINPNNVVALNNRGLAYRKKGDIERAITDYNAAIRRSPIYALAYVNRGYAWEAMGQKKKAIADLKRAISIRPSLSGARSGLKRLGVSSAIADVQKNIQHGQKLAEKNCARCHAIGNKGVSPNAKAPPFRVLQKRHPLLELHEPITRGIATPHDEMPKFRLSDTEIDKIVAYVHSLSLKPQKKER